MKNQELNIPFIIGNIKRDFFIFRNGIIANSLKKLYSDDKIIIGLNAPQFMELAKKYPKNLDLGLALWKEKNNRESRLFSLYIIPSEKLDKETAKSMIYDVESCEEAEFLSFKLLKHLQFGKELYEELSKENECSPMSCYCLNMLKKNLDQI